jgi:hypothetical protein
VIDENTLPLRDIEMQQILAFAPVAVLAVLLILGIYGLRSKSTSATASARP